MPTVGPHPSGHDEEETREWLTTRSRSSGTSLGTRRSATPPRAQANARFGIAVSRRWQNRQTSEWEEQTSFFNVVCWGDMAENVSDSIGKGTRVIVHGPARAAQLGDRARREAQRRRDRRRRGRPEPALGDGRGEALRASGWRRLGGGGGGGGGGSGGGGGAAGPRRRPAAGAAATTTTSARRALLDRTSARPQERERAARLEGRRPKAHAQEEGVDPQPESDRLGRLQGRQPAPALHVGAGQDPRPPRHRQQRAAAARGRPGDPRRPRDGVAAVQRAPGDPAQSGRRRDRGDRGDRGDLSRADADAGRTAARRRRARRAARRRDARSGLGDDGGSTATRRGSALEVEIDVDGASDAETTNEGRAPRRRREARPQGRPARGRRRLRPQLPRAPWARDRRDEGRGRSRPTAMRRNRSDPRRPRPGSGPGARGRGSPRAPIQVTARAGEGGKLFGSVTTADIVAAVKEQTGVELDRRKIDARRAAQGARPGRGAGPAAPRGRPSTLAVEVVAE